MQKRVTLLQLVPVRVVISVIVGYLRQAKRPIIDCNP